MAGSRIDRFIECRGEYVAACYCPSLNFIIGVDDSFILLHRRILDASTEIVPKTSTISFGGLAECGLIGRVHLVNVSTENPDDYKFEVYGGLVTFENGADYTGKTLSSAATPVMAELARADYLQAKHSRRRSLCWVDARVGNRFLTYRRFVVPLVDHRDKVSHLLVGVTPNLWHLGLGPFHGAGYGSAPQ